MRTLGEREEAIIKAADAAAFLRDDLQACYTHAHAVAEEVLVMTMLEQVSHIANVLERMKDEAALEGDME